MFAPSLGGAEGRMRMDRTWIKRVFERLRGWRYFSAALYGALLLLAVLFYGVGDGWFAAAPRDGPVKAETTLESRLEDILSTVLGAGRVRVLITYSTAGERVAATVSTMDESVSETSGGATATRSEQSREMKQPATISVDGGQSPIILVEKEPEIRGVLVVAEGAADPTVRLSLQRAVQAVTGVSLSCIEVFEMNYPS
jgi:stage III sporulation protein AG